MSDVVLRRPYRTLAALFRSQTPSPTRLLLLLQAVLALCYNSMATGGCRVGGGGGPSGQANQWDYIVVGAGPAGLQMGYYLKKANRSYVILERNNVPGSFFETYPRHNKLISINKLNTGRTNKEFNLRHDWNSLLSDDDQLLFRQFSREFFPRREDMLRYLAAYAGRWCLNVRYNTTVSNIERQPGDQPHGNHRETGHHVFTMDDQHGNVYRAKYLLVATGLWTPTVPPYQGMELAEGYETASTAPADYEGQHVLVLGHGNAAFETADVIYGTANLVHVAGRSRVRLSWETHYVGDVRGVNNNLLDTYQLKSLDGIVEGRLEDVRFERQEDGMIRVSLSDDLMADNFALRESYHKVIRCLGFHFDDSLFNQSTRPLRGLERLAKFPLIDPDFHVLGVPDMYAMGAISHSLDFRKSAGGFLHGFRYTVRALHRILEWRNHAEPWPSRRQPIGELLTSVTRRMNEASGIYQMFSVLGDVISFDRNSSSFEQFEDFPLALLPEFPDITGSSLHKCVVMVMQYGLNYSGPGKDVFKESRSTGFANHAHRSNFLHPVFYYFDHLPTVSEMDNRPDGWPLPRPQRLHHVVEDFLTTWTGYSSHLLPLRRFLEVSTNQDLRYFPASFCFEAAMTSRTLPWHCERDLMTGQGTVLNSTCLHKMKSLEVLTR